MRTWNGRPGWLVWDPVCHLAIDAQDVLIALVTPAETDPTVDAVTYWDLVEPPTGEDPLEALILWLAAAYGEPRWLKFHFDNVGPPRAAPPSSPIPPSASAPATKGEDGADGTLIRLVNCCAVGAGTSWSG
jgi:hypothetical protein